MYADKGWVKAQNEHLEKLYEKEEYLTKIVQGIQEMINDEEYKPTKEELNKDLELILEGVEDVI